MKKLSEENQQVWIVLKTTFADRFIRLFLVLALILFISALTVIYVKNSYREHFIALQQAYTTHDQLETEWAQLLLEESTWAAHTHVEGVAEQNLNMIVPTSKSIQLLTLPALPSTLFMGNGS